MKRLLLDFHATWCEPCKWSEPIVEKIVHELDSMIELRKIDIDLHPDLAEKHGVKSVPTFILMDGERELWRMNGFDTAPKMINAIRTSLHQHE